MKKKERKIDRGRKRNKKGKEKERETKEDKY